MDRFANNNEFDRDVIMERMYEISSKLKEESEKSDEEYDAEREKQLIYAQFIQGLKLNTLHSRWNYNF